jgi:uncharacterized protein
MDISQALSSFGSLPIPFFFLGILAVLIKSNLEIPQPISKFFSLYLLFSIGFKGGVELSQSGVNTEIMETLGLCIFMAVVVPVYSFFILKRKASVADAAAIAATYGSISAVTFATATSFLKTKGIDFGGHMVAGMALMESPAIIIGVILYNQYAHFSGNTDERPSIGHIIREGFTEGSVVLLLGALVVGVITGEKGHHAIAPLTDDLYKGFLCLFLLDMGLVAAKRLKDLRKAGMFFVGFGLVVPILNAAVTILICKAFALPLGDAFLLTVLCASASYIAVPAAMRVAIPESNPSLYVPLSLAVTFPFNITIGIPFYFSILEMIL